MEPKIEVQQSFIDKGKTAIVEYFNTQVDKTDNLQITVGDVYVVWQCKTLQNNKAMLSTTVSDGIYLEW